MNNRMVRPVAGLANVETRDGDGDVIEEVDLTAVAVPRGYAKKRRGTVVQAPVNKRKRPGNGAQGG